MNGFNVVSQQFIATVVRQFILQPGFKLPAHRSTMTQINMIPYPVTLNWH